MHFPQFLKFDSVRSVRARPLNLEILFYLLRLHSPNTSVHARAEACTDTRTYVHAHKQVKCLCTSKDKAFCQGQCALHKGNAQAET